VDLITPRLTVALFRPKNAAEAKASSAPNIVYPCR
jgi:hypothetical protein